MSLKGHDRGFIASKLSMSPLRAPELRQHGNIPRRATWRSSWISTEVSTLESDTSGFGSWLCSTLRFPGPQFHYQLKRGVIVRMGETRYVGFLVLPCPLHRDWGRRIRQDAKRMCDVAVSPRKGPWLSPKLEGGNRQICSSVTRLKGFTIWSTLN